MKRLILLLLAIPAFGQTYNRTDGTLQNALGQALSGATVYVCTQPCSSTPANHGTIPPSPLATIFQDNAGTPTANPGYATTDGNGNFFFYSTLSTFTEVFVYRGRVVKVLPDQVPQGASAAVTTAGSVPATPIYALAGATLTPDANFGDSTGLGDLFANKSFSINGTGFVWTFKTQTAPPPPASGFMEWYGDSATKLWTCINSDGSNCGPGGAGSGTVTNFTSGNLSPLFTTSVATSNTTPALTFAASTFAPHTFYGNNTGSTATPGAQAIGTADLGTGTANSTTFLRGDGTWATPSGANAPSCVGVGSSDTITAAGAFATTCSLGAPAGVGSIVVVDAQGVYTTTGTSTPLFGMQVNALGTTGICPPIGSITLSVNQTAGPWNLHCEIQIVTTGAPGTAWAWGTDFTSGPLGGSSQFRLMGNGTTAPSATTTSAQTVSIQETATPVAGQSFTLQSFTAVIRNP